MSDRRELKPDEIRAVGVEVCPDIANFLDSVAAKANAAGTLRGSAFGDHALLEVWSEDYNLFYECVYETGQNTRAMGKALEATAATQEDLEAELAASFQSYETEIESQGVAPSASENFETPPESAPTPGADNPFWDSLSDDPQPE